MPRLALPEIDDPGEIARYLFGEGLPGEFPFLNGAYREMYLEPLPNDSDVEAAVSAADRAVSAAERAVSAAQALPGKSGRHGRRYNRKNRPACSPV